MVSKGRQGVGGELGELNVENRTLFLGDNLDVLRGLNSGCVDLVYLDPPFNSNRNYVASVGSVASGAGFKDAWSVDDIDEVWLGLLAEEQPDVYQVCDAAGVSHGKGMKSYLVFMAMRLLELRRVLKPVGSIYLQCDLSAGHYLKLVMDVIFGRGNFRNEIVWQRCHGKRAAKNPRKFATVTDSLFFYRLGDGGVFELSFRPLDAGYVKSTYHHDDGDGKGPYRYGSRFRDRKYYLSNSRGVPLTNLWDDVKMLNGPAREATGYPTQKPEALLERIIKASSGEGDVVLDPFCGSGTACVVAERLGRQWVGVDCNAKAIEVSRGRLEREMDRWRLLWGAGGKDVHVGCESGVPERTDGSC